MILVVSEPRRLVAQNNKVIDGFGMLAWNSELAWILLRNGQSTVGGPKCTKMDHSRDQNGPFGPCCSRGC